MKAKILTLVLIAFSVIGCSSDDDNDNVSNYPEENPLADFLIQTGFIEKTRNDINTLFYETGYVFEPKTKGKINAITCKFPNSMSNVRVTIWNANTKIALKTITIPNVEANVELRHPIEPLNLAANTEYAITCMINNLYKRNRNDASSVTYPISTGSTDIKGVIDSRTGISQPNETAVFPEYNIFHAYYGDLSIVFQRKD